MCLVGFARQPYLLPVSNALQLYGLISGQCMLVIQQLVSIFRYDHVVVKLFGFCLQP